MMYDVLSLALTTLGVVLALIQLMSDHHDDDRRGHGDTPVE